ncbi:MAG: 6-bladed beta-propeller [Prevotellaceae bacterium]|jgi:hypothetical protein|nr:6-bladed beta-propeller [Prevotellaceae bacterium]
MIRKEKTVRVIINRLIVGILFGILCCVTWMNKINIILLSVLFFSCKEPEPSQVETICINFQEAKSIDLSMGSMIELETTDSSLLYDIARILFFREKLFVLTREKVVVFDSKGKYLFNLSGTGQGPGEYTAFGNMFIKGEYIYVFDKMTKRVLCFDDNGKYLSAEKIPENTYPVSDVYPLADGWFVGKNMFRGDHEHTPVGSVLDDKYGWIEGDNSRKVTTGLTSYDNFFQYRDHILYWEMLCDTIFSIQEYKNMIPRYYVDFGAYAIPPYERKNKDVYDLIDYTNRPENVNKTATYIRFVSEDEHNVHFMFAFRRKTPFVFYNKHNKTANVYFFEDKNNEFIPALFACYHDKHVYLSVMSETDMEKNPYLIVFDENVFK